MNPEDSSFPESDVPRVMDAMRRLVRVLRVSTRNVEKEIGISGAQLFVLQQLAVTPALTINELASRTQTHQSSVSSVVSRLAERGLVRRQPSSEDARRVQVRLTPEGQELLNQAPGTAQARLIEGLHRLPPEQVRFLAQALESWLLQADVHETPTFFFEDDPAQEEQDG